MLDAPSGPNLDLLCVQQLGAAPFCENYAKLYFNSKHFEKGLNKGAEIFGSLFFKKKKKKNVHFGQYWKLPKFSRLDPAHHNIQLYDLLVVCPFNPKHSKYCEIKLE